MRSIRLNPLRVVSYGQGEHGTILVTKFFGRTEIFVLAESLGDVATKLGSARGLCPDPVEFELANVEKDH